MIEAFRSALGRVARPSRRLLDDSDANVAHLDPMAIIHVSHVFVAVLSILACPVLSLYGGASKVISLTTGNFAKETRGPGPVLVEFYAPYVLRWRSESLPLRSRG